MLQALAKERGLESQVRFFGVIPPSEIPAWLAKSDVGILPIRCDVFLEFAFPNKLPEYIIMGKPVIISRLRTIRHYFSEEALGFFEPNSAADLARQMARVYGDRGLRARLSSRAREEYAPIRWEVMKQRYLKLVGDLVGVAVENPERCRESADRARV